MKKILLQFNLFLLDFLMSIFENVIYFCDGKAEFSVLVLDIFVETVIHVQVKNHKKNNCWKVTKKIIMLQNIYIWTVLTNAVLLNFLYSS